VREGVCWSAVETQPFVYDFSEVKNRIEAAHEFDIQQVWDLCHFGYPSDLIPTHPQFAKRFAALCEMFAYFYKQYAKQTLFVVPINEISFLSWHSGDVRGTVPFAINSGFDIKYHLCKAAIAGIKALRMADPDCRIILVEPLVKVHPANENCNLEEVEKLNEHQFQAMDIIAGYMCPELGGEEINLDILGFNYYHNNQWEYNGEPLPWPECEKRVTLTSLLVMAYERYKKPIFLSETGFFGDGRAQWLKQITDECEQAILNGVDLKGICIYPVTDRPDWDDLTYYCKCGLWDLDDKKNRIPDLPYLNILSDCQQQIITTIQKSTTRPIPILSN